MLAFLLGLLGWSWVTACAPGLFADQHQHPNRHTLTYSRVVDLSHTITQNMPHHPGAPATIITRSLTAGTVQSVHLSLQNGTRLRLSSVLHQTPHQTIDQRSPRDWIAPAVVLDVRDAAQDNPDYRLSTYEILVWEQQHGRVPADSMVLLATGWDMRWGNAAEYLHLNDRDVPQVPGLSAAALALLHERQVAGIGIDTPLFFSQAEPGMVSDVALPAHDWLLLENLTSVEQLPPTDTTLIIGSLKVQDSLVSPAHVLALVP